MIMAYRGDFGEENWWGVNHGITMEPVLNALRIPYTIVRDSERIKPAIHKAVLRAETSMYTQLLLLKGRNQMNRFECMKRLANKLSDD